MITKTPYRISLFGGGTDLPEAYNYLPGGGAVLSFPINKYITTVVVPRIDGKFRIGWSKKPELVDSPEDISHELARECIKRVGIKNGVEINYTGHIPAESGLGSSAAVTVGTLLALYTFANKHASQEELANIAYEIERGLGKYCGKQDQYDCAIGGLKYVQFLPDRVIVRKIPVSNEVAGEIEQNLHLYHTGIKREQNAGSSLQKQCESANDKRQQLIKLREIVEVGNQQISNGDISSIGELLDRSWQQKRQLQSVTNDEIDFLYDISRKCGSRGGKLCGAGLGGSFLAYSEDLGFNKRFVKKANENGFNLLEIPYKIDTNGSEVIWDE